MKKSLGWILLLAFVVLGVCTAWASPSKTLDQLLDERTANVWIDGQQLGDLVLGARARLTFVYVDRALSAAARQDPAAPEWLVWHSRHLGEKYLKGKALFILRFETFTPWELLPENLFVETYSLVSEDLLTRKEYTPSGELPSGFTGTLSFSVPKAFVKPGQELSLGYGKESAKWKVPGK